MHASLGSSFVLTCAAARGHGARGAGDEGRRAGESHGGHEAPQGRAALQGGGALHAAALVLVP